MSDLFRTGIDPEKTGRGLRGIGFIVIVFAFLIASNKFVSTGDKAKPTSTSATSPAVAVVADAALQPALTKIDRTPTFTFAPDAAPTTPPASLDRADVVITANAAGMAALVDAKRCAPPVAVAIDSRVKPALTYRACAVMHDGAVRPTAQAFIGKVAGLDGRVVLVDAGFDLPERVN